MSKRRRPSKSTTSDTAGRAASRRTSALALPGTVVVWAVFLARWLVPTEDAAAGGTLWLTTLTFLVAAGWCWLQVRSGSTPLRVSQLDLAVWLFAGTHVVAALAVVFTDGQKRFAMNMLWEWTAIAVQFTLLRQTLRHPELRAGFARMMLIAAASLAGLGVWQHYAWYPANVRDYDRLRSELDSVVEAIESGTATAAERRRAGQIHAEFLRQGVPLNEPQRGLFEHRLRQSREPLGLFALANSFAAVMLVGFVFATGAFGASARDWLHLRVEGDSPGAARLVISGLILVLLAYCLLLTKSRTAWGGTAIAAAVLGFIFIRRNAGHRVWRRFVLGSVSCAAVATCLVTVAFLTDALDFEVISEAPKSLQYRMEYWTGSWRVFGDQPLLGTGPGNFRNHYLQHKLPQSSEEIADPHQLFLDVTANAGLAGLIGLLAVIVVAALKLRGPENSQSNTTETTIAAGPGGLAAALAGLLVSCWSFISESQLAWSAMVVGIAAAVLCQLEHRFRFLRQRLDGSWLRPAVIAAVVGLFVHLQAAGGVAMPAIAGLMLALVALGEAGSISGSPDDSRAEDLSNAARPWLAGAGVNMLCLAVLLPTTFLPATNAQTLIQTGDYELSVTGDLTRARRAYEQAAVADPFSPEPLQRLSQLTLQALQDGGSETAFERAVDVSRLAIELDPHNPLARHHFSRVYTLRFEQTGEIEQATQAIRSLESALAGYPTEPGWNAEYALILQNAGQPGKARAAALEAIKLDDLNREAGHIDRYLPDERRHAMQKLIGRTDE